MRRRIVPDVTRHRDVPCLAGAASVGEASRAMRRHGLGCVLVAEAGRLSGIVTKRDIVERVVAEGRDPERTRLAEVMTRDPDTIGPDRTPMDALRLMHDRSRRHLPVTEGGRVIGIVSRRDFAADEKAELEREVRLFERLW